jgi:hypothetical protein
MKGGSITPGKLSSSLNEWSHWSMGGMRPS